jgi:cytochrome P450
MQIMTPGPRGISGIIALINFFTDPLRFINTEVSKYTIFRLPVGKEALIFINDSGWINDVLMDKQSCFQKDSVSRSLISIIGHGLLTSEGDQWLIQRQLHLPLFTRTKVNAYFSLMSAYINSMLDDLDTLGRRDVHKSAKSLTISVVVACLLGQSAVSKLPDLHEFMTVLLSEYQLLMQSWRRFMPAWIPLQARRRIKDNLSILNAACLKVVECEQNNPEGNNLVSALLAEQVRVGESRKWVLDQVATILLAGHQTTSSAVAMTLWLLAIHPSVQEEVYAEIIQVNGNSQISSECFHRLNLLRAVVLESLRLFPPAWVMGREAKVDFQLGPYTIKVSEEIVISPWLINRHEKYFYAPNEFIPLRWLDSKRLNKTIPFLPFGGGSRKCIAEDFAMQEILLIIASTVQRFRLSGAEANVQLMPSITLEPKHGIWLNINKRDT